MNLAKLQLTNFRSYDEREFVFDQDVTVLVGKNGAGKTNVLEAVYMLFQGKSFRDGDEQLVRHGETWWKLGADVSGVVRELRYQPAATVRKQLLVDAASKGRFTYRHQLPVVLFEPDDLLMLHGSPSRRRRYLDTLLIATQPTYRQILAKYDRALLQRNNILKKAQKRRMEAETLRDDMFVWDVALAEHSARIMQQREQLLQLLQLGLAEEYSRLAGSETAVHIRYEPSVSHASKLAGGLHASLEKDIARGFTGVGPHRDDIAFDLQGVLATQTASRGEVRSIILALKSREIALLRDTYGLPPLYLLDDVFSELDPDRQKAVLHNTDNVQKIITTTHGVKGSLYTINL